MSYAICISKGSYHLTVGKEYKLFDSDSDSILFDYIVMNDKGISHGIESELFSIQKRRDNLINKILDYENNKN